MSEMSETYAEFAKIKKERNVKKRIKNRNAFDIACKKYKFIIIKEVNNIITFEYNSLTYYFTEITGKYRMKGNKIGTGLAGLIDEKESKDKKYTLKFGKYIGYTLEEVYKINVQYLNWLLTLDNLEKSCRDKISGYIEEQKLIC